MNNRTISLDYIPFDQPMGNFLLTVMRADQIILISRADPRKFDKISLETIGGIQREPSRKRINEISKYAETVDASFPTPILLAINEENYSFDNGKISLTGKEFADIVDGQHRVLGLKESVKANEFNIPVVFILDPSEEQKALIFATINGKQTKVPASIIYDLFGVTETRSPQKTAHEIARALNSSPDSPWHRRLKMLGKKTPGSIESLSQGTFIKFLLPLISDKPDEDRNLIKSNKKAPIRKKCIFNGYWRDHEDSVILRILINLFQAVKKCWPSEWDNPTSSILTKTTGFTGIIKAFPRIFEIGKEQNDLSLSFFEDKFNIVKTSMQDSELEFTSDHFPSSSKGENKLKNTILGALDLLS